MIFPVFLSPLHFYRFFFWRRRIIFGRKRKVVLDPNSLIFLISFRLRYSLIFFRCCRKKCPLKPGINFTNVLRSAFESADTKSAKKTDGLTVFFALLGSVHIVKAASPMPNVPFFLLTEYQYITSFQYLKYLKVLSIFS